MKVEIRGYIYEGTPEEIKEYVKDNQAYIQTMLRFNKCPTCNSDLGEVQTSKPIYNYYQQQHIIIHSRSCTNRKCRL